MKIARIGCCDPRVEKDGVYYCASVGGEVFPEMIRNLSPILQVVQELQLVAHRDCGASRVQLGLPFSGELTEVEQQQVEQVTQKRLLSSFVALCGHPLVQSALEKGVRFRIGIDELPGIQWLKSPLRALLEFDDQTCVRGSFTSMLSPS